MARVNFLPALCAARFVAASLKTDEHDSAPAMNEIGALAAPAHMIAMLPASEVELEDDEAVIGVDLPTGPRAYVLSGDTMMSTHNINDVVDGRPLSITYCPRTECARVFTKHDAHSPLDLMLGGFRRGEMYVRFGGAMYPQGSSEIPLDEVKSTRTDWKTWRESRPDTVIFLDRPAREASSKS